MMYSVYTVAIAVGEKSRLRQKRHRTVKKSILLLILITEAREI